MIERRELFPILAAAAAPGSARAAGPRFFSESEYAALQRLCDLLLPADDRSPAAGEARVPWYIDLVVAYSDETARAGWRAGLRAVEEAARSLHGRNFLQSSAAEQDRVMAQMARNEERPLTELERFFGRLKRLAIEAYCNSEAGRRQYLSYRGDGAVPEFRGCTHPEHQR